MAVIALILNGFIENYNSIINTIKNETIELEEIAPGVFGNRLTKSDPDYYEEQKDIEKTKRKLGH